MNIFDLGGHSEYYSCSGLFIAASGIFLVCVDSSDFKTQSFHEEYYCRIGCYIDFISQTTFEHKVPAKVVLVATKVEHSEEEKVRDWLQTMLNHTKDHLMRIETKCYLLDEIIRTSSKRVSKDMMDEICTKLSILCSETFKMGGSEVIPKSWLKFLDELKKTPWTTLNEAKRLWTLIVENDWTSDEGESVSSADIDILNKLTELISSVNFQMRPKKETLRIQKTQESKRSAKAGASLIRPGPPAIEKKRTNTFVTKSQQNIAQSEHPSIQVLHFFYTSWRHSVVQRQ